MKMSDRIKRNMQPHKPMTLISLRPPDHVIHDPDLASAARSRHRGSQRGRSVARLWGLPGAHPALRPDRSPRIRYGEPGMPGNSAFSWSRKRFIRCPMQPEPETISERPKGLAGAHR